MSDLVKEQNAVLADLTQKWLAAFSVNDWQTAEALSRQMDSIESELAELAGQ